ncbi:hypothetical protein BGX31_003553 [Mortierella sp. GBA43]|nr:hypothetical protein BGX31_003553 [Mortierella sp. GBA43]
MSKFKAPTDRAVDYPSAATKVSMEDLALKLEQAKDHLRNIEGDSLVVIKAQHWIAPASQIDVAQLVSSQVCPASALDLKREGFMFLKTETERKLWRVTAISGRKMAFGSIISSPRGNLSFSQVLELANVYLENARIAVDRDIALALCHDTEVSLNLVKRAAKNTEDKAMRAGIATVYIALGDLLTNQGHQVEAQAFFKKSEKWG